jgi:hypothetical protein
MMAAQKSDLQRASEVEKTYRIREGLYLLGSMEKGVTVYNQQIRAHNLIWALWELQRNNKRRAGRVAVVGGGIAGLTAAACCVALFERSTSVTLFERLLDICPIQQGADGRWLHPRIYDWPFDGSRAPSASLPVLNWSEGRASDVARMILREFGEYCESFASDDTRLSVFLGLRHFQIDAAKKSISWVATKSNRAGSFFQLDDPGGMSSNFDTIILAAGFGLEARTPPYSLESYWRNEQLAQPFLDGSQRRYLVSGFGDGALVDLCRLTIERFRQDTIFYELFPSGLERLERHLSDGIKRLGAEANLFKLLERIEAEALLDDAKRELKRRIRKDTAVTLHLRGRKGEIKVFSQIFGRNSSFLNRLLTYLLYRCGAFALEFTPLDKAVARHDVPVSNVLCRYGADTIGQLSELFSNPAIIKPRLLELKEAQEQRPVRLWAPGVFQHYLRR